MENKGKRRTIIVLHIKDVFCTLIGCSFSLRNRGSRPKMPIIREMVQNNLQFFLDVLIFTAVINNKPRIFCTVYGTTAGERERERDRSIVLCSILWGQKKWWTHFWWDSFLVQMLLPRKKTSCKTGGQHGQRKRSEFSEKIREEKIVFRCCCFRSGTIMKRKKFNKKKYYRVSYAGNVETDQLQKKYGCCYSYKTLFQLHNALFLVT